MSNFAVGNDKKSEKMNKPQYAFAKGLGDVHAPDYVTLEYLDSDLAILSDIRQLPDYNAIKMDDINVLLFCRKGRLQFDVSGRQMTVTERQVAVIQSSTIVGNYMMSPDFQCYAACLSDRLVKSQLHQHIDIWNRALFVNNINIVDIPPENPTEQLNHFFELMISYINAPRGIFREEAIASLVRCMLLDLCGLFYEHLPEQPDKPGTQGEQLFNRFLKLLGETPIKHQTVDYYAQQLFVSPKYLSAVCKQASGKTAMEWIHDYTVVDIRYHLLETPLSIKEISIRMGFPNLSFFGKYVRQHLGVSPKQYRQHNGNHNQEKAVSHSVPRPRIELGTKL